MRVLFRHSDDARVKQFQFQPAADAIAITHNFARFSVGFRLQHFHCFRHHRVLRFSFHFDGVHFSLSTFFFCFDKILTMKTTATAHENGLTHSGGETHESEAFERGGRRAGTGLS